MNRAGNSIIAVVLASSVGLVALSTPSVAQSDDECAALQGTPDACVTVELLIDRDYALGALSHDKLKSFESVVPARSIAFPAGSTISGVIAQEYSLGRDATNAGVPFEYQEA